MSCYVCNEDTFIRVLKAWSIQGEALRYLPSKDELEKAWNEIVSLNYDAWNERYPEHKMYPTEEELKCPVSGVQLSYMNFSKREMYDALKEYMYQVCDAEDYEHREGYYKCRWCLDTMLHRFIEDEEGK
jgi:hypothetical protein